MISITIVGHFLGHTYIKNTYHLLIWSFKLLLVSSFTLILMLLLFVRFTILKTTYTPTICWTIVKISIGRVIHI